MRERNNWENRMSILAPHIRREVELEIGKLDMHTSAPDQLEVAGRRVYLFTGEDAYDQALRSLEQFLQEGKAPISGVEKFGGACYFVA